MRFANKWNHVMLAVALDFNSAEQNHLVVAFNFGEGAAEWLRWIH